MAIFERLITTICTIVIVREVLELIVPSGKIYGFVSMALGLVTSYVIIQKIIELINSLI